MSQFQRRDNPFSVLIVDDEPGMLDVLSICFADEGYNVYTASSGRDAIHILSEVDPDLIVTDVRMPNGDGRTLIQNIRALEEDAPIIFCISGYQDMTPPEMFLSGIDHFFPKPLDFDAILAASKHFLTNRRTKRRNFSKAGPSLESLGSINAILQNLQDFFFILDSNFKFMHCSKSFAAAYETTEQEICKRSFLDFLTPFDAREFKTSIGSVLEGKIESSIVSFSSLNEKVLPIEISWAQGQWHNQRIIFALARDLTFQNELEKRVESRVQGDLKLTKVQLEIATALGQDLKTPLQAIVGYASMLENSAVSSREKRFTQSILKAANTLNTLMNEFFTIASSGIDTQAGSATEFSLPQLIDEVVCLVNTLSSNEKDPLIHRAKASSLFSPNMSLYFRGKPLCLRQVLSVLLKQATYHAAGDHVLMQVNSSSDHSSLEFVFKGISEPFEVDTVCAHLVALINGKLCHECSKTGERTLQLTVPAFKT